MDAAPGGSALGRGVEVAPFERVDSRGGIVEHRIFTVDIRQITVAKWLVCSKSLRLATRSL